MTCDEPQRSLANIPFDVLVTIFEEYRLLHSKPFPEVVLTQVCRFWRYSGISYAGLWNNFSISPQTPAAIVGLYLQRSRDTPITLECDLRRIGQWRYSIHEATRVADIWTLVVQAAPYWRRLSIKFDELDARIVMQDLCRVRTPLLGRLLLWTNVQNDTNNTIFGKDVLNLEVLSLKGVYFQQFTSSTVRTLKHLDLSSCKSIPLADFRGLINQMPLLEFLSLGGNVVDQWPIQLDEAPIKIPSLLSLRLSDQPLPIIIPLLSISAPQIRECTLIDFTAEDLAIVEAIRYLQQNYPVIESLVLAGNLTEVSDCGFRRLAQGFPGIRRLALTDAGEFQVQELCCAMKQTSLWPQLQAITLAQSSEGHVCITSVKNKLETPKRYSDICGLTRQEWINRH